MALVDCLRGIVTPTTTLIGPLGGQQLGPYRRGTGANLFQGRFNFPNGGSILGAGNFCTSTTSRGFFVAHVHCIHCIKKHAFLQNQSLERAMTYLVSRVSCCLGWACKASDETTGNQNQRFHIGKSWRQSRFVVGTANTIEHHPVLNKGKSNNAHSRSLQIDESEVMEYKSCARVREWSHNTSSSSMNYSMEQTEWRTPGETCRKSLASVTRPMLHPIPMTPWGW